LPCDSLLNVRAKLNPRTYQELRSNPALLEALRAHVETLTRLRPVKLNVTPSAVVINVDGNELTIRLDESGLNIQGYARVDGRAMQQPLQSFADELALEVVKVKAAQAVRSLGTVVSDRTLKSGVRVMQMEL
jgi:hypothetical protein